MKAKFVLESIQDLLKPKSIEEIKSNKDPLFELYANIHRDLIEFWTNIGIKFGEKMHINDVYNILSKGNIGFVYFIEPFNKMYKEIDSPKYLIPKDSFISGGGFIELYASPITKVGKESKSRLKLASFLLDDYSKKYKINLT